MSEASEPITWTFACEPVPDGVRVTFAAVGVPFILDDDVLTAMQAAAERARADAAERRAAEALGLSQGLHARIVSAFGRGSSAHRALLVAVDDAPGA